MGGQEQGIGIMAIIDGTPGDDTLVGTSDPDTINGYGGNDQIIGLEGDDYLYGGDGHDLLFGYEGNDFMYGESGDDFLRGYDGDDYLDGGDGFDRISYADATIGVTVDLNTQGVAQNTGWGWDTLVGIESVSGSAHDDTILGNAQVNWLWGGSDGSGTSGNDTIFGGGGNDLIEVGSGNHELDGGTGIDSLSLWGNNTDTAGAVTVDLDLQGGVQDTGQGIMALSGFENLSGSIHGDTLAGDSGDNWIGGDLGDDTVSGGAGSDMLYGDGRIAADTPTGGSGPITFYTDVSMIDPSLIGGNDVLEGGLGDDIIDGGAGNDTASYANASGAVSVALGEGALAGFSDGADGTDSLYDIENLTGSAFNDQLIGNSGANVLTGSAGDDNVRGRGGNDVLNGDDGHDFIVGGDGNDTLNGGNHDDYLRGGEGDDVIAGGAGYDRAAFTVLINNPVIGETGVQTGATVNLILQGTAQNTGHGMDTLTGIEHVSGTAYNDTLIGDGNDNWIWGEGGDDNLQGGGGNDLVETDAGNSVLNGGTGVDTAGFNGLDSFSSGVSVSLALQESAQAVAPGSNITLSNFENLTGTLHDDALTGDDNANVLAGNAGNDTLSGGKGDDTLYGDGAIRPDTHDIGGSGPITTYADLSVVFPGTFAAGNDTLDGGQGDDILYGGGGDDVMTGGQGSDTFVIEANSGNDTVTDFSKNHDLITFDIAGVDDLGDLTLAASGNDTLITWGTGGDSLLLEGVKPKQLDASSFDFGSTPSATMSSVEPEYLHNLGFAALGAQGGSDNGLIL